MHRVAELYIYPIKGFPGISLKEAKLQEEGLQYDRRWMLVDEQGVFLSQRSHPILTQIKQTLHKDTLNITLGNKEIAIDLENSSNNILDVSVFDDSMQANEVDTKASEAISNYLNQKVLLVRQSGKTKRKKDFQKYLDKMEHSEGLPASALVSFADGYPYLICGTASLEDLNSKLEQPVGMDRFRPNIVIETERPWEEDEWNKIKIGGHGMLVVKPCGRCQVVTIDQKTGVKSKEPLATLATFRKIGGKVMFGQNAVTLSEGIIRLDDEISFE